MNLSLVIAGVFMGIAEIIPGISGSTVALVFGIYDDVIELIDSVINLIKRSIPKLIRLDVKSVFNDSKNLNWTLVRNLLIGITASYIGFVQVVHLLLDDYRPEFLAALAGIVLISAYIPLKIIRTKELQKSSIAIFLLTLISIIFVTGLGDGTPREEIGFLSLIAIGFVSSIAMTLPGISGSFVMLLFGIYDYFIDVIKEIFSFNFTRLPSLLTFVLGIVLGMMSTVKIIKYCLHNYNQQTMAFLLALMLGSLRIFNPFTEISTNTDIFQRIALFSIFFIITGFFIIKNANELTKLD